MAPRDFDGFEKLGGEFDFQPTAYPERPGAFLSETHKDYSALSRTMRRSVRPVRQVARACDDSGARSGR
jgi:hypothetical protein